MQHTGKHEREWQLLLLTARSVSTDSQRQRIEALLREPIDWPYIIRTATRHRIHFLLYKTLCHHSEYLSDNPSFVSLKQRWHACSTRAVQLYAKLIGLMTLFGSENIQAIPFKGSVLGDLAYGDFTLREFGDLDILVSRNHAIRSIRLLETKGFQPELSLDDRQLKSFISQKNGLSFTSRYSGLAVDLHWEMSAKYVPSPMTYEAFETRLRNITIENKTITLPSTEDVLLYQCIHGSRECWCYLESISSLAGLITRNPGINWHLVWQLAGQHRCERILLVPLHMAHRLFDIELPNYITSQFEKDKRIEALSTLICGHLLADEHSEQNRKANDKFSLLHFKFRPQWREKARYAKYLLFNATTQDWLHYPLHGRLSFLHLILRPARLVFKYVQKE